MDWLSFPTDVSLLYICQPAWLDDNLAASQTLITTALTKKNPTLPRLEEVASFTLTG